MLWAAVLFITCPIERLVEDGESMRTGQLLRLPLFWLLVLLMVCSGASEASLSPLPIIGLAGCALCGVSVGIMWPGTISISAQKCPMGGTAMFAFLALVGDLGATVGPSMVGRFSGMAGGDLKISLFFAAIFPVVLIFILFVLRRMVENPLSK